VDGELEVATFRVGTVAFKCSVKTSAIFTAIAVSVADCMALTDDTVATKLALVSLSGTVTEDGTVTDELLLTRITLNPPLAAAELNVIVQVSVPAPVIDALTQDRSLNIGVAVAAGADVDPVAANRAIDKLFNKKIKKTKRKRLIEQIEVKLCRQGFSRRSLLLRENVLFVDDFLSDGGRTKAECILHLYGALDRGLSRVPACNFLSEELSKTRVSFLCYLQSYCIDLVLFTKIEIFM
jgi:hypothetical protein